MAKKQKRQVSRVNPAVHETLSAQPVGESAAPARTQSAAARSSYSSTTEFNPDYSYVISDLKRIGILASTFIGILVVLSFFLR